MKKELRPEIKTYNINLSNSEKLGLISNLATMLSAGIPILETVDSLSEGSKGNIKKVLESLKDDLSQGKHVYYSFSRFPSIFDKVTVNIIKAAEEAGTLETTLKDLKENIKKQMEFNDKIKSALTYPVLILVLFLAVMLMMLVVVVPKIATVFVSLNMDLPLPTRILIFLSNLIVNNTIPFFVGITAIIAFLIFLFKREKRMFIHFFSSLPIMSKLTKEIDLTRFSHSLYLLLDSGIPITSALELTQDVVSRKDIEKAIIHSKELVLSGKKLSEGFKDSKNVIPNIVVKLTEAGERSGSLDKSMQEISEHLDYEVSNSLRMLTALLEPLMLIFVGILIGGMMLSIIAPIYGLISQVSQR